MYANAFLRMRSYTRPYLVAIFNISNYVFKHFLLINNIFPALCESGRKLGVFVTSHGSIVSTVFILEKVRATFHWQNWK